MSGGINVYSSDLGQVLNAHSPVREAAVIGVPHLRWGEIPLAVVVPAGTGAVEPAALLAWANARLGKHQRVSAVVFRPSLPRNAGGKVLKRALADELAGSR